MILGNIQKNKNLVRSRASNFDLTQGSKKGNDSDFDYNEYSKENHLDSLEEVSDFAKDHHLFLRNM